MRIFAFVDASNLFYGGEKSLGWKIDYKKLFEYLKEKYSTSKVLYFGGVEIHNFQYDYQKDETVPLKDLRAHLLQFLHDKGGELDEAQLLLISRHIQRVKFYLKLEEFGYSLFLKPVKLYDQGDGTTKRKANCDVDMAFWLMKEKEKYNRVVIVLARGERTAREIRQFAGGNFRDFVRLRSEIEYTKKKI